MGRSSTGLASYMSESVPSTRWELYTLRFEVLFFLLMWIATGAFTARMLSIALAASLIASAVNYGMERYGSEFFKSHKLARVVLLLALLVILLAIAWFAIGRNGHKARVSSKIGIGNPSAPHLRAANRERPTTNL